jgi:hypothetical protein
MARLLRQRRWCACINNVHGAKKKGVLKNTKFKTGFGLIVPGGTDFCRFNFSVEQKKKKMFTSGISLYYVSRLIRTTRTGPTVRQALYFII